MKIRIKAIASDLWDVYDLDKPEEEQLIGVAASEEEAENAAAQYEAEQRSNPT